MSSGTAHEEGRGNTPAVRWNPKVRMNEKQSTLLGPNYAPNQLHCRLDQDVLPQFCLPEAQINPFRRKKHPSELLQFFIPSANFQPKERKRTVGKDSLLTDMGAYQILILNNCG